MSEINHRVKDTKTDSTFAAQWERICQKPATTEDPEKTKFGSMDGRMYCAMQTAHTIPREPYRMLKNMFIVAEKIVKFSRCLLECICEKRKWADCDKKSKKMLSSLGAVPLHLVNWILDIAKFAGGIIVPSLAIHHDGTAEKQDEAKEESEKGQIVET